MLVPYRKISVKIQTMLVDQVTIRIQSGSGGRGSMATYNRKLEGGDGGNGGSVFLKGTRNIYDLGMYDPERQYSAENGKNGLQGNRNGPNGKDLTLLVPLTTEVEMRGELIAKITEDGQIFKVLSGGLGAYGNISLRRQHDSIDGDPDRSESKNAKIKLILKLKSDVIFIGYPNAGKSSILNSLTRNTVKTADYAFTTLEPQLGMMDGVLLMDLPGLIEGAHEGKGLGIEFVKHTEYSKLLAHFVSLENSNPFDVYTTLREEIRKISLDLYNKKEIVVLTKSDEVSPEIAKIAEKIFKKKGIEVISCSIIDDDSLAKLKAKFKELTD